LDSLPKKTILTDPVPTLLKTGAGSYLRLWHCECVTSPDLDNSSKSKWFNFNKKKVKKFLTWKLEESQATNNIKWRRKKLILLLASH
jgi:hypothetical protein